MGKLFADRARPKHPRTLRTASHLRGLALPVEDGLNVFSPSCRCHSALAATPGTRSPNQLALSCQRQLVPHLNTVSEFRPWRLNTLKVVWWPCLRPSPLGMGGLRRSVQTCPFPRRTLDHGRRTLHDCSFYGRERHGKVASLMENITSRLLLWLSTSIKCQSRAPHQRAQQSSQFINRVHRYSSLLPLTFFLRFCRIRSTTWLVLGRLHPGVPGRAAPDLRVRPWPPPGGRGRWQWRWPGCTCTSGAVSPSPCMQCRFYSFLSSGKAFYG